MGASSTNSLPMLQQALKLVELSQMLLIEHNIIEKYLKNEK